MKRALTASVALTLLAAAAAMAHPHFNKTVTAKLPSGVDATVTYNTTPANEIHAAKAAVGTFVTPRRPLLKLSGEIKTGAVTIPQGTPPDVYVSQALITDTRHYRSYSGASSPFAGTSGQLPLPGDPTVTVVDASTP